jgi:hypothetical protein
MDCMIRTIEGRENTSSDVKKYAFHKYKHLKERDNMNKNLTAWAVGGLLAFTVVGFNFFDGSVAKAAEEIPSIEMQGSMMQDGSRNRMNAGNAKENCNAMMQDAGMQNRMNTMMQDQDGKMKENMKDRMKVRPSRFRGHEIGQKKRLKYRIA